jgi:hypothetical protein
MGDPSPYGEWAARVMREDIGEVTTSLQRPVTGTGRSNGARHVDSFEIQPPAPRRHNGVPRSAWARARRRASRWHRPYTLLLVLLDFGAAAFASWFAIMNFDQAAAGFSIGENNANWFHTVSYVLLPLGWVILLWANRAYDRRHLGLGTEEFKRVVRASVAVAASVSFLAFATKTDLSRLTVGTALLGTMLLILVTRFLARAVLHVIRSQAGYTRPSPAARPPASIRWPST